MSEFHHIPIETSQGHRPPSQAGDRLLVGLAVLALSGGLLLAGLNLLVSDEDAVANASPTPSARPRSTPRPTPTERPRIEFTLEPGTPPVSEPIAEETFSGWIRAKTDIVLHASPDEDAAELGTLAAGAFAYADGWGFSGPLQPGWLHVLAPSPEAWIATSDGATDLVERYEPGPIPSSASVWQVLAGAEGFVMVGTPPSRSGDDAPPLLYTSTDGAEWRRSSDTTRFASRYGYYGSTLAWGPAGWLMITMPDPENDPSAWVWQSADGESWTSLGTMAGLQGNAPSRLVASEVGYLLTVEDRGRGGIASLFASPDGVTWHESADPGFENVDWGLQLAATPLGFLAWNGDEGPVNATSPSFSRDGLAWSATDGPSGAGLQVASLADQIVAVEIDPDSGFVGVWLGTAAGAGIAWQRDEDADAAFRGAHVSSLVGDGRKAIAFGWEISTDEPLAWTFDGERWTRSALPDAFRGGIPRNAAGGGAGIVLQGYRPTLRGPNPIFWHLTSSGGWLPERTPVFEVVPDPSGDECGALPSDVLTFSSIDRAMAVACFGSAPTTFRAYAVPCDGCFWDAPGIREPEWLLGDTEAQLYLSPITSAEWGGTSAMVHPSVTYDPSWVDQWLEVTGHFDDPEAKHCRWMPAQSDRSYYEGLQATIDGCRMQFVITAVNVVDGP
jgi:hypothetical protein